MTTIDDSFWQACVSVPSALKPQWTPAQLNECALPAIRSPDAAVRWPASAWNAVRYLLFLDSLWQERLEDWNWSACQSWLDTEGIPVIDPWPLAVLAHPPYTPDDAVDRFSELLHHPVTPGPVLWAYASWRWVRSQGRLAVVPHPELDAYRDPKWPLALARLLARVASTVRDERQDPPHFISALAMLSQDAPPSQDNDATAFPARYPYALVAEWRKTTAMIPEPAPTGPAEQLRFD